VVCLRLATEVATPCNYRSRARKSALFSLTTAFLALKRGRAMLAHYGKRHYTFARPDRYLNFRIGASQVQGVNQPGVFVAE
jgi:hypothetical protein